MLHIDLTEMSTVMVADKKSVDDISTIIPKHEIKTEFSEYVEKMVMTLMYKFARLGTEQIISESVDTTYEEELNKKSPAPGDKLEANINQKNTIVVKSEPMDASLKSYRKRKSLPLENEVKALSQSKMQKKLDPVNLTPKNQTHPFPFPLPSQLKLESMDIKAIPNNVVMVPIWMLPKFVTVSQF